MGGIEILEIDSLINVTVGVFKIKLFHIDFIDFQFDLFDVFGPDGESNIILSLEEFLSFFDNNGDLL